MSWSDYAGAREVFALYNEIKSRGDSLGRADFLAQIILGDIANGISSRNLALDALGIRPLDPYEYPLDFGDWGRCLRTYEATDDVDLRAAMAPTMRVWAAHLHLSWAAQETAELDERSTG